MALTQQQKEWLQSHPELKPRYSMKRRNEYHDYTSRCIYMITLVVEGRHPLLGALCDRDAYHTSPWVNLTPLGKEVRRCWNEIPKHYPQVTPIRLQLMPDHMHGILFVTEKTPHHLGRIINGFKIGCNKALRELSPTMSPMTQTSQATHLWEEGYHDRILVGKDQLKRMIDYLIDNPRRRLLKSSHPNLFKVHKMVTICNQEMSAMGNIFLLNQPSIVAVKCSRSLVGEKLDKETHRLISLAQQGAILISPCISDGEKHVFRIAHEMGYSTIVILAHSLKPLWKPGGKLFDACAQGKLLLISPWQQHDEPKKLTKEICNQLNTIATCIANVTFK